MVRRFSDARGLRSLRAAAEPWIQFFTLHPDAIWLGVLNGWLQDGPPQYRWPSSWSCRWCLCLVSSMTVGLVDVVSACLELCETSKLFTDVHTPILKECSLCNFVCCTVRRDLAHNLSDWDLGSLSEWRLPVSCLLSPRRGNTRWARIQSLYSCEWFIITG
jgi:hypothetical protein